MQPDSGEQSSVDERGESIHRSGPCPRLGRETQINALNRYNAIRAVAASFFPKTEN